MVVSGLVCQTLGNVFLTMKWSDRTAQGFSPGLVGIDGCPESGTNLADAGCNSDLAHYSHTPSLRAAGFEDEDDDENENEAPSSGTTIGPMRARNDSSDLSQNLRVRKTLGSLLPPAMLRTHQDEETPSGADLRPPAPRGGLDCRSSLRLELPRTLCPMPGRDRVAQ
jgi:hypothetical protein